MMIFLRFNVRLGEWNTDTDPDCIDYPGGIQFCAASAINIKIDKIIPHSGYSRNSRNHVDDIGLVRLASNVYYNNFIRPICIPSSLQHLQLKTDEKVVVSGWGRTLTSKRSAIKQKLTIGIADRDECLKIFSSREVTIVDSQICAGGKFREDTCDSDSGGPLMRQSQGIWFAEGIVSFGRACGLEGWPGIYTRVRSYGDWIRSNLEP